MEGRLVCWQGAAWGCTAWAACTGTPTVTRSTHRYVGGREQIGAAGGRSGAVSAGRANVHACARTSVQRAEAGLSWMHVCACLCVRFGAAGPVGWKVHARKPVSMLGWAGVPCCRKPLSAPAMHLVPLHGCGVCTWAGEARAVTCGPSDLCGLGVAGCSFNMVGWDAREHALSCKHACHICHTRHTRLCMLASPYA